MITFDSEKPHKTAKFILVTNFTDVNDVIYEVWNLPVLDYKIHDLTNKIGLWKPKKLKK